MKLRKRRPRPRKPLLTEDLILQWADDHFSHFGAWPTADSGGVRAALNERWSAISMALRAGVRGLPGGSSLARLLARRRQVRNKKGLSRLTIKKILRWADDYHERTGRWPTALSGPIPDATPGETWQRVSLAIYHGCRGFAPGSSVAWILAEHRGVGTYYTKTTLSEKEILSWADNYHRHHGRWPTVTDEPIPESVGDSWKRIDSALRLGQRDLTGGTSLAQLLCQERNVPNRSNLPSLTIKQILAWADAFHLEHGKWPTEHSGPIAGAAHESWGRIEAALRFGRRGLSPGGSLARLLESSGRKRNRKNNPKLSEATILRWAEQHYRQTGRWPTAKSGTVLTMPEETWRAVDSALTQGTRGLKGGSSLLKFLIRQRGIPNPLDPPRLTIEQIRKWAREHFLRTGRWPQANSVPINTQPRITWSAVNDALRNGRRGFPGGSSLSIVLARSRRSM